MKSLCTPQDKNQTLRVHPEPDMRICTPHNKQLIRRTRTLEWREEWVDEEKRMGGGVEMGEWEQQFIRKVHGVYIQPGLSCMQGRTDTLLRRLEGLDLTRRD